MVELRADIIRYHPSQTKLIFYAHEISVSSSTGLKLHWECWSLLTVFLKPSKWSSSSWDVKRCRFTSWYWDFPDSTETPNVVLLEFLKCWVLVFLSILLWVGLEYSATRSWQLPTLTQRTKVGFWLSSLTPKHCAVGQGEGNNCNKPGSESLSFFLPPSLIYLYQRSGWEKPGGRC